MKLSDAIEKVLISEAEDLAIYQGGSSCVPEILNDKSFSVRDWLVTKTFGFRRGIAQRLVPRTFALSSLLNDLLYACPRPMILFVKGWLKDVPAVGVEIGVAAGDNSLNILNTLCVKKLFLVDPYLPYYEGRSCLSYSHLKEVAWLRLKKFPQSVFVRKPSSVAVEDINESLDFVYIDGDHSYLAVKDDIEKYYSKVKLGGIIGGHDYAPLNKDVMRAVDDFVKQHDRSRFYAVFPDWWYIKES
jgi:hypothetical protein